MMKAKSDGSISTLRSTDPAMQKLAAMSEEDDYRIGAPLLQVVNGVAVISVSGSLVPSYAWYNEYYGIVSYEEIKDAFAMAAEDGNVKKILMVVESSGGSVAYLDDTANFIRNIDKNVKPVEGHTSSHAHSAGYWLLSSCRKVSSARMATTGSIGVIMTMVNYAKALADSGVQYTYVRSGEFKALGQSGEELSPKALEEAEELVGELFDFFLDHVLTSRGRVAAANQSKWSTGKVFLPVKALSYGLIDEITTLNGHIANLFEESRATQFSTETQSLSKEAIMALKTLTAAQQAKLASGVALKELGLTDAEFKAAEAELAAIPKGKSAESADAADEETAEVTADEETAEVTAEEEGGNVATSAEVATLSKLNSDLNKLLARAEIALESEQALHTETKEQITALTDMQTKLVTIAGTAASKFSIAMGGQEISVDGLSAEAVFTQYTALESKFNATFTIGATSNQTIDTRSSQESLKPNNTIVKKG